MSSQARVGTSARIVGLGMWLPQATRPHAGGTRHVASAALGAAEAEVLAAQAALLDAGAEPADVDVVLSHSAGRRTDGATGARRVAELLGVGREHAMDGAAAGSLLQLQQAAALIESGRARVVLLTLSHLSPRGAHTHTGDGASALLLAAWPGMRVGRLRVRGDAAQDVASNAEALLGDLLAEEGLPPGALCALAAVHPAAGIPATIAARLGLDPARAPSSFARTAHLGDCDLVSNLLEARERQLLEPGGAIALYAEGPELRAGALLHID